MARSPTASRSSRLSSDLFADCACVRLLHSALSCARFARPITAQPLLGGMAGSVGSSQSVTVSISSKIAIASSRPRMLRVRITCRIARGFSCGAHTKIVEVPSVSRSSVRWWLIDLTLGAQRQATTQPRGEESRSRVPVLEMVLTRSPPILTFAPRIVVCVFWPLAEPVIEYRTRARCEL